MRWRRKTGGSCSLVVSVWTILMVILPPGSLRSPGTSSAGWMTCQRKLTHILCSLIYIFVGRLHNTFYKKDFSTLLINIAKADPERVRTPLPIFGYMLHAECQSQCILLLLRKCFPQIAPEAVSEHKNCKEHWKAPEHLVIYRAPVNSWICPWIACQFT